MSRAQRRTSSKSGSFYEKDEKSQREASLDNEHDLEMLMDRPKSNKKNKLIYTLLLIAFSFVIGGSIVRSLNFSTSSSSPTSTKSGSFLSSSSKFSNIEKFQKDQEDLLNKVLEGSGEANHISSPSSQKVNVYQGPDVEGENAKWFFQKFFEYLTNSNEDRPLNKYINKDTPIIDTLSLLEDEISRMKLVGVEVKEEVAVKEAEKLESVNAAAAIVNAAQKIDSVPSPKVKSPPTSGVSSGSLRDSSSLINAQSDLKEILSVSPLTIILNDDPQVSSKEAKAMEKQIQTIISGIRITPQPTLVNLIRHPHYKQIIEYLKTYQTHVKDSTTPESDEKKTEEVIEVAVEEVPALFIGGEPVANYGEIIDMYNKKELTSFLRKTGKGLISVE